MRRLILVLVALAARPAAAHDFWLFPDTHDTGPATVPVRVEVGSILEVDEIERRPEHIKRFEALGPTGVIAATGVPAKSPAGYVALTDPGIYSVIYESGHSLVELEPRRFDNYLAEEGLLEIIADRERRGEAEKLGRDSFSRYAKALIRVGGARDGFDRRTGMATELVALVDPFVGGADGSLAFELWYAGQPKPNAQVDLFAVEQTKIRLVASARTGAEGRVTFATPGLGRWMVAATGMRRASPPLEGDWESSWASLTFQVVTLEGASSKRSSKPIALAAATATAALLLAGWWLWKRRAKR
jgi:uncharacterized GH25 family protein